VSLYIMEDKGNTVMKKKKKKKKKKGTRERREWETDMGDRGTFISLDMWRQGRFCYCLKESFFWLFFIFYFII